MKIIPITFLGQGWHNHSTHLNICRTLLVHLCTVCLHTTFSTNANCSPRNLASFHQCFRLQSRPWVRTMKIKQSSSWKVFRRFDIILREVQKHHHIVLYPFSTRLFSLVSDFPDSDFWSSTLLSFTSLSSYLWGPTQNFKTHLLILAALLMFRFARHIFRNSFHEKAKKQLMKELWSDPVQHGEIWGYEMGPKDFR